VEKQRLVAFAVIRIALVIVMQRKSFFNVSGALNTAIAQLLIRKLKPPPGVTNSGKPEPTSW
jgi:hypothetical protein